MTTILRLATALLFAGASSLPMLLDAAETPADDSPGKKIDGLVEELAEDQEGEVAGADPGEASYNTENCAQPGEPVAGEVDADDLDEECVPLIK